MGDEGITAAAHTVNRMEPSDHPGPQAREPVAPGDRKQGRGQLFEGVRGGHRGSSRAPSGFPALARPGLLPPNRQSVKIREDAPSSR